MRTTCVLLICSICIGCTSREQGSNDGGVRLRFDPNAKPTSPLESTKGAVISRLHAGLFSSPDREGMNAQASIGDTFPVARENEPSLFEVRMKDGNDDRLTLEVSYKNELNVITLQRDEAKSLTVEGVAYDFLYPSTEVAATDNKLTTNKATIFISTPKKPSENP